MEKGSLKGSINELFIYFRYKAQAIDDVIDSWYPKVRHIPAEAMPWIVDEIEKLETLPRNLPRSIIAYWYQWKKQHPEKLLFEKQDCPDCGHKGYFIISKVLDGQAIKTQMMIECATCNNLDARFSTRVFMHEQPLGVTIPFRLAKDTRYDLEKLGHTIIFPPKPSERGSRIPNANEVRVFIAEIKEILGIDVARESRKKNLREQKEE